MARILLTGGAGYIASHTAVALIERGHDIVLLDNFANAERDVPARIEKLTGKAIPVVEVDIRDVPAVIAAFKNWPTDAVIHFAALKAVGESETDPILYYDMNIAGTIRLFQAMQEAAVTRLVFSSSATVYGQPDSSPILEDAPTRVNNIYGGFDPRPRPHRQTQSRRQFTLFQPGRRASFRDDRRNPDRRSKQSDAVSDPSRNRAAPAPQRVRQ